MAAFGMLKGIQNTMWPNNKGQLMRPDQRPLNEWLMLAALDGRLCKCTGKTNRSHFSQGTDALPTFMAGEGQLSMPLMLPSHPTTFTSLAAAVMMIRVLLNVETQL